MSDTNTSNPRDNLGSNTPEVQKYELLTAYIDNELRDSKEIQEIEAGIEKDPDLHNRYLFEKLTKQRLRSSKNNSGAPQYLRQNVENDIANYMKLASAKHERNVNQTSVSLNPKKHKYDDPKSNLKRYFMLGTAVFVLLIISAFAINFFIKKSPALASNDLVAVSRNVFDKVISGEIPLQIKSNDARILADSMNKYLDFEVFVPDVKDAELVGGTCNEINGEKLAHIIHKKDNIFIYTLQGNKDHVMKEGSKIVLCPDFMENVSKGINWFACLKDENAVAVIWYKNGVICSSVAKMESKAIADLLTNYKAK
jgi:hypothetical protein